MPPLTTSECERLMTVRRHLESAALALPKRPGLSPFGRELQMLIAGCDDLILDSGFAPPPVEDFDAGSYTLDFTRCPKADPMPDEREAAHAATGCWPEDCGINDPAMARHGEGEC